jgi:hypothetical protein
VRLRAGRRSPAARLALVGESVRLLCEEVVNRRFKCCEMILRARDLLSAAVERVSHEALSSGGRLAGIETSMKRTGFSLPTGNRIGSAFGH